MQILIPEVRVGLRCGIDDMLQVTPLLPVLGPHFHTNPLAPCPGRGTVQPGGSPGQLAWAWLSAPSLLSCSLFWVGPGWLSWEWGGACAQRGVTPLASPGPGPRFTPHLERSRV